MRGEGSVCGEGDVELLSLLVMFKAETGELGKTGGDRDTSSGLGRCRRGRIITRVGQRRTGT